MTEPDHLRGNALRGRSLSEVTEAVDRVRFSAVERGTDPRNVAKGHWRDLQDYQLLAPLREEVDELVDAVWNDEPIERVLAEAGDVVLVVAMIVDWRVRR